MHGPMLWHGVSGRLSFFFVRFLGRGICPFCNKIRQRSSLDDSCCVEVQVERLQLDVPPCDTISGVGVAQDLLQGEGCNHHDGVPLEVVSQFSGGNEEREEELLLHGVPFASVAQHSADEVYWMLDEDRLGCGSIGSLGRLVRGLVEGCLWRGLDREACGRLD